MPAISPELVSALTKATEALSALVAQLSGQSTTGGGASTAATGAQALAGGPGVGQTPGQSPSSGCGCGGASGAVDGAADVGQAPPKGADAGPSKGGGKDKASKGGGASGAPEAQGAAPTQGGGSSLGAKMVEEVKKYLGTKYVFGGASPSGFDCSGLMLYVAKKFGINLPHKASIQATKGTEVSKNDLQPGDMVFFNTTGSGIGHVGMYIGNGQMIHAPKTGDVVKVSSINDSYYSSRFVTARRMG